MKERDISSFYSKHKHMLENGAPSDKFGVLNSLLQTEFHGVFGLSHFSSRY